VDRFAANSERSVMSPIQEPTLDPTFVGPHPRHPARRVHDCWWITGTEYQHDYQYHLVDDDKPAPDDYDPAAHHDENPAGTRHRTATVGSSSDRLPTGDRRPDREALVPVRTGRGAVGDRDRLARVELPTRRSEPGAMFQCPPVGPPLTRRVLRGGRVSRLVRSAFRRRSQHCSGCTALRVCWFITLATLTWVVL
jgi:hypothetical protein